MRPHYGEADYEAIVAKRVGWDGPVTPLKEKRVAFSPYRSKLEAAWAGKLELDRRIDLWSSIQYEPVNFRLPGTKNFYRPDFLVVDALDHLIFYEVKGRNKSDDRSLVKMKTAAGLNPWARFVLVKREQGQWTERTIT